MAQRNAAGGGVADDGTWVQDTTMLRALNLGVHETFAYLYGSAPTFEQFKAWILEKNGGAIEPDRIEAIDAKPALTHDDLAFFDEYGYVVLHDAVSSQHVRAAVNAVCDSLAIDLDRPETWRRDAAGRDPVVPLLHHPALDENRRSSRIRSAFAQLWKRDDLLVSIDRCEVNFPETPDFPYSGQTLHWDVSLVPPIPFGVRGLLYLTDTEAHQGAFTCVPGFHRKIEQWLAQMPSHIDPRQVDLYRLGAASVPGKAGDFIIFHQAVPHAGSPNRAKTPQLVQHITLLPTTWEHTSAWR